MLKRLALITSIVVLSIFIFYVYTLNTEYEKENLIRELDNGLLLTKNLLEEEQRHALAISALISQDSDFLTAYYNDDRKKAFDVVNRKLKDLSLVDGSKLDVQVHDKNSNTYLRSWDYNITNVPLSSFREGIVVVKQTKKAVVSVEVGKRLNIKAISPIIKRDKFEGSIEVITGFTHLQENLLKHGYTMFILLDKQYLNITTSLKNNPIIKDKFVLVNKQIDETILNKLKSSDLISLGSYGYFNNGNISFGYFRLNNLHNKQIGYCIVALKNKVSTTLEKHYLENKTEKNKVGVIIR